MKVITYSTPRTLEFKSCPVFPFCDLNHPLKLTDRQADKTTSMLVVVTHLKHLTAVLAGNNDTFLTENITEDRKRFITQSKHMIF